MNLPESSVSQVSRVQLSEMMCDDLMKMVSTGNSTQRAVTGREGGTESLGVVRALERIADDGEGRQLMRLKATDGLRT